MHARQRLAVIVIIAAAGIAPAAPEVAQARAGSPKEMAARKAFAAGDWDKALDLYSDLYAETLHPVYLRNIGRIHQKKRDPARAIDAFQDYLAKSKTVSPEERQEVEGYIKEMEALRDEVAKQAAKDQRDQSDRERAAAAVHPPEAQPAPPRESPLFPPQPVVASHASPAVADSAEPPLYKKWWLWTAVAALVAGGVAAAVLVNRSGGGTNDVCKTVMCK
jgi:hypothetical protein